MIWPFVHISRIEKLAEGFKARQAKLEALNAELLAEVDRLKGDVKFLEEPCEECAARPDVWQDLESFRLAAPAWPRIVSSEVWQKDLRPWLRRLLMETMEMMTREQDANALPLWQVRARLLEGLIMEPETHVERMKALLDNQFGAGEMEPAQTGRG